MTFSNAFSWMQIYEFWLNFHWSLFARVQLTIYTSVGSDNGLAPASDKLLSFCTLCVDQSVHLRNRTVTSLDMWILHWRRSHWCLKSPVTQLDCLFNRLFRQTSTVTDGFPSQKASNAASVGPMLVQRWHTTIGATLCQRWPNVGPMLGHRWANVGAPPLGQLTNPRWPNVGEPTLAQRKGWRWANVAMLAGMTSTNSSNDRLVLRQNVEINSNEYFSCDVFFREWNRRPRGLETSLRNHQEIRLWVQSYFYDLLWFIERLSVKLFIYSSFVTIDDVIFFFLKNFPS